MKSHSTKKTWKNDEVTQPSIFFLSDHQPIVDSDDDSDSDAYQDIPDGQEPSVQIPTERSNSDSNSDSDSDSDSETMRKAAPKTLPKEETNFSDVEDIIEEGRLFIRNLPYSCTEEEIRAYAQRFGEVVDVFIPLNGDRKSKGYCFVTFMFPEQAAKAIEVREL